MSGFISNGSSSSIRRCDENADDNRFEDSEKLLCVVMMNNKLGAAYYDTDTNILYMLKDVIENAHFSTLKKLLVQVRPKIVIMSSKQKEDFVTLVQKFGIEDSSVMCRYTVEILPGNVFNYELCKQRIISINGLPGLRDNMSDGDRSIYFSSRIPFENYSMVSSIGALLKFLDRVRPGVELEHNTQVPILFMQVFFLNDLMSVDEYTYSALQIFQRESHPSVFKTGGGKEGLSLFGMVAYLYLST